LPAKYGSNKLSDYIDDNIQNKEVFNNLFLELEKSGFDFIVVDIATGYNNFRDSILPYSYLIIIPFLADGFSLQGWQALKNSTIYHKSKLKDEIFVINMIMGEENETKFIENIKSEIGTKKHIFEIEYDQNILKAEQKKSFVEEMFPESNAVTVYERIATQIIMMIT
jgi:cellulose biosynthesis protein BcsQ